MPPRSHLVKWLLLGGLLLTPCDAGTHEIGTTTVRLTLHRGQTWTALIITAPQVLANALEREAGQPRSNGLGADLLRAELEDFRTALARHIEVRFDSIVSPTTASVSEIEVVQDAVRPDFVVLKATGSIPPAART